MAKVEPFSENINPLPMSAFVSVPGNGKLVPLRVSIQGMFPVPPSFRGRFPICPWNFTYAFAAIHLCVFINSPTCSELFTYVFVSILLCVLSRSPVCPKLFPQLTRLATQRPKADIPAAHTQQASHGPLTSQLSYAECPAKLETTP